MIELGGVTLPLIVTIDEIDEAEVEEIYNSTIDNTVVNHGPSVQTLGIGGYVNQEIHPEHKTIDEQKRELKTLRNKGVIDISIDYRNYYGHFLITDIDFTDNSNSRIVNEVEITGHYFPWPKYFPEDKP